MRDARRLFVTGVHSMTPDQLRAQFKRYILDQKLCTEAAFDTSGDATAYLQLPHLTGTQREWLENFIRRLEAAEKALQPKRYLLTAEDIRYLTALAEAEGALQPESRHLAYPPAPVGLLDRLAYGEVAA
jgi:hypothetical protein